MGQEFSGYVVQLRLAKDAIEISLPSLYGLAIGGTAVGTGINTHPEFGFRVARLLSEFTGIPFVSANNKFAALAGHEPLVFVHGALKVLATSLMKISTDIRWMASGPRTGLGELILPENEPGSSIMPGKVNPTQCEAIAMICFQVMANDVAIGMSAASGNFELNVFKPLILHNFLQSIRILSGGISSFTQFCINGIEPNIARIDELMSQSLLLVTYLTPYIGYDKAAEISKSAHTRKINLRETAVMSGYVTGDQFDLWVNPR